MLNKKLALVLGMLLMSLGCSSLTRGEFEARRGVVDDAIVDTFDTGDIIDTDSVSGDEVICYKDADGDGYGRRKATVFKGRTCPQKPERYVRRDGDCDDTRADVNPGAPEICNDGRDNNCNGLIDEEDPECDFGDTHKPPVDTDDPPPTDGPKECGAMTALTVQVNYGASEVKRHLSIQEFLNPIDIGGWWLHSDQAVNPKVTANVCGNICGVRFNVTQGAGSWFCQGHVKSDVTLNPLNAKVSITLNGKYYNEHDLLAWSDPGGIDKGCSAILFFDNGCRTSGLPGTVTSP